MFIHPHRWQCLFILTNGYVYSPRPVTIPFFPHLPVILELVMYLKTNGNYWWCLSPTRENWVMISSPEGNTVKVFDIGGNRCSWLSWRIVIVTTTTRTVMTDCIYVCVCWQDFGDYSDDYYSVQSTEGEQISQLIAGYIDIIVKKVHFPQPPPAVSLHLSANAVHCH